MGQFVTGLDSRLLNGEVDLTVHSSKDVPTDLAESILQVGHLERAPPHDLLLFAPHTVASPPSTICSATLGPSPHPLKRWPIFRPTPTLAPSP